MGCRCRQQLHGAMAVLRSSTDRARQSCTEHTLAHLASAHAPAGSQLHGAGSVVVSGPTVASVARHNRTRLGETETGSPTLLLALRSLSDKRDKSHGRPVNRRHMAWAKRDSSQHQTLTLKSCINVFKMHFYFKILNLFTVTYRSRDCHRGTTPRFCELGPDTETLSKVKMETKNGI